MKKNLLFTMMVSALFTFHSCSKDALPEPEEPGTEVPKEEEEPNKENETVKPPIGDVEINKLYGYATMGSGTTGGDAATTANIHHFNSGSKFNEWLKAREKNKSEVPAIVYLSGTFNKDEGRGSGSPWFDIKRTSNITIIGTDAFRMNNVGFFLNEAKNIIIRNVYILLPKADNGADGISMQESSNVWVDHCTFESVNQTKDYEDGACDVTHGTYNVTLSWNRFIQTQKTSLIGHSDSNGSEDVNIRVTMHHNFFDRTSSRTPRVRFGKVHVYNNFFNQVSTYGVGSAFSAKVLVESNVFDGVRLPTDICTYPAKQSGSSWVSNLTGKEAGFLFATEDNIFNNKPSNASDPYPFINVEYKAYNGEKLEKPLTYNDFKPEYSYVVDDPSKVQAIVVANAGVGHLNYANAPIEVNNGGLGVDEPTTPEEPTQPTEPTTPTTPPTIDGWAGLDVGSALGANAVENGNITVTGAGKFESGAQAFRFVYREISGDFEIIAKVNSYDTEATGNNSQAGLMMSTNINASGTDFIHAMVGKGGGSSFYYSQRLATGNAGRGNVAAPSTTGGDTYLKLKRIGNKYEAAVSLDGGATWGTTRSGTFTGNDLPEKMYVGMAVNSGNTTKTATAVFSNITITPTR